MGCPVLGERHLSRSSQDSVFSSDQCRVLGIHRHYTAWDVLFLDARQHARSFQASDSFSRVVSVLVAPFLAVALSVDPVSGSSKLQANLNCRRNRCRLDASVGFVSVSLCLGAAFRVAPSLLLGVPVWCSLGLLVLVLAGTRCSCGSRFFLLVFSFWRFTWGIISRTDTVSGIPSYTPNVVQAVSLPPSLSSAFHKRRLRPPTRASNVTA